MIGCVLPGSTSADHTLNTLRLLNIFIFLYINFYITFNLKNLFIGIVECIQFKRIIKMYKKLRYADRLKDKQHGNNNPN